MDITPSAQETKGKALRILEVGRHPLFAAAAREQVDFLRASHAPADGARSLGPIAYVKALKRLRRAEYDLLVLHPLEHPYWHARSVLQIILSHRARFFPALFSTFASRILHLGHTVPIVAVDLRDSFSIGAHNSHLLDAARLYFKRELPVDRWHTFLRSSHRNPPGRTWRSQPRSQRWFAKLRPISLGATLPPADMPSVPKTTDVFFAGSSATNSAVRADGIEELRALKAEGYRVDIPDGRLTETEFHRRLAAAWLAWSPAGFGWDCLRHYEAAASGTVPLINYPTIHRDLPLVDGEHCLFYAPELGGLTAAIRAALADKPHLLHIAKNARAHVYAHHTSEARVERIVAAVLGRRLDGSFVSEALVSSPRAQPTL